MFVNLRFLLCSLWLCVFTGVGAQAASVVVVSSERSPAYIQAAQAMASELERGGVPRHDILQLTAAELADAAPLVPKLFVALGLEAARVLAKTELRVPVLCTLLPRNSFERVLLESGRKPSAQFSAVYLDQPLTRQLDLIRIALPAARRVGVLWGPESQGQAAALKIFAHSRGLELVEATVGGSELFFTELKRLLDDVDLLLAVADPQVFNSSSIQNILLSSFRAKVPLVAFSPAYVRAGALLAVHVAPEQVGRQAAALALGVMQGKALPTSPVYSQDFSVAVNEHVARSLGLSLDAQDLRERLRRREGLL